MIRRTFLKSLAAGSATAFATPMTLWGQSRQEFRALPTQREIRNFTETTYSADIIVAGGGLAGVCAAIAAARNGASVILVQDRSRLGGNSSSEIRMHVLGANNHRFTRNWRETGLIEELKLTESATNLQRSFEMWDLILYDKVISEPNITLLLDTAVIDAELNARGYIERVMAISPLLEEKVILTGQFFVDCTGDSALAARAGAEYMWGREGKKTFGESLAPDEPDHKTMGNSIMFFAKKHDREMPFIKPAWAKTYTEKDFQHRRIRSYEYGYWWIEWGGELDTIKDNRKIRHELLAIVMGVWDYIKNSGDHPDAASYALDWVGMIPGKRENRRLLGDHVMIQQEMEHQDMYPDRVAYGGWPMDDHPPEGMDRTDQSPYRSIKMQKPYNIPFRSLYSRNIPNLLMAGRNISASHVAFSSTRVRATCAAIGQAAGTGAAFAVQNHCTPREIVENKEVFDRFQQLLLRDDQSLLNVRNSDDNDLARHACVRASHETREGPAVAVIDGWNRNIEDGQTHQWQAAWRKEPWIELEWSGPQQIRMVQLTFDSGLDRKLYLSGSDGEYHAQTRGAQPEIVSDYRLECEHSNGRRSFIEQKDNVVRLVRHQVEWQDVKKLRLSILATHGDDLARVFEIRCYA